MKYYIFLLIFLIQSALCSLSAENLREGHEPAHWNLPLKISTENTKISFELDSTWHAFEGTVTKAYGLVWLSDPKDYKSVKAKIHLPVVSFDTDNGSRDKKMRKVMAEDRFSEVLFNLDQLDGICSPQEIAVSKHCSFEVSGKLNIRGVKKDISFPALIKLENEKYTISAQTVIDWSDFGVEDPSIFIAKVYKDVTISIELSI